MCAITCNIYPSTVMLRMRRAFNESKPLKNEHFMIPWPYSGITEENHSRDVRKMKMIADSYIYCHPLSLEVFMKTRGSTHNVQENLIEATKFALKRSICADINASL